MKTLEIWTKIKEWFINGIVAISPLSLILLGVGGFWAVYQVFLKPEADYSREQHFKRLEEEYQNNYTRLEKDCQNNYFRLDEDYKKNYDLLKEGYQGIYDNQQSTFEKLMALRDDNIKSLEEHIIELKDNIESRDKHISILQDSLNEIKSLGQFITVCNAPFNDFTYLMGEYLYLRPGLFVNSNSYTISIIMDTCRYERDAFDDNDIPCVVRKETSFFIGSLIPVSVLDGQYLIRVVSVESTKYVRIELYKTT